LIVDVQRLGPGRSPVGGAEDATGVALRLEEAAQRCDEEDIRISRIHEDRRNLLSAVEADATPRASGIRGLVHPVAKPGEEGVEIAGPDVNHIGV